MTRVTPLLLLACFSLLAIFALQILPALAAEAVVASTPAAKSMTVLMWLNTTQGIVFTVAALWIIREAARRYVASQKLKDDDVIRNYLMGFLDILVDASFARLGVPVVQATAAGRATVEQALQREAEVGVATRDAMATVGDAARRFGITEVGMRERINRRLDARVGANTALVADRSAISAANG